MTYKKDLGTVIVTGASRGIGAAVATLAGGAGYAVAVNFATSETDAAKVVDAIMAGGGGAVGHAGRRRTRGRCHSNVSDGGAKVRSDQGTGEQCGRNGRVRAGGRSLACGARE